jgi:putative NIF3 family GTP cyclohydrolase 1 type 2
MADLSRREFAALTAAAAVSPFACIEQLSAAGPITAQDLIDRIKKNIGVEWKPDSVDTFKAGAPSTFASGIVTTSMATLPVLRQAMKAGANVIISAQPTFYARADTPTPPPPRGGGSAGLDRVFAAKNEFIARNNLVVFRLSDHWRLRQPDPFAQGLARALGLGGSKEQDPPYLVGSTKQDPAYLTISAVTLDAMASSVKKTLRSRGGIRVVGDPRMTIRRVGLLPGTTPIQSALRMLPNVDVIIAGEVREWESVEYVRDQVFRGAKKGLILVGHVVSEEPGMDVCANWLRTFISEVPIRHISAGDPYWRPA